MEFTGNEVRTVRKKHKLTRKELGQYLDVSPVTIEKWEQQGSKVVRPKYHEKLAQLGGVGIAGVVAGIAFAPALLAPALMLGGAAAGFGALVSDDDLEKAGKLLDGLKKLTPEERKTLFELSRKIQGGEN